MDLREPTHRVSPRARAYWAAEAAGKVIVVLIVLLAFTAAWNVFGLPWWAWVAIGLALAGYVVVVPALRWRIHRWEIGAQAVYTQTGWLSRERRIAPLNRVQTVDFEQHPIARMLRLATVTVTTASAAGPLKISGLDLGTAETLVADLTERTAADDGDAT